MAGYGRDEVTIPGAGGGPGRPAPPARAANAGPVTEDDVTEWLGDAGPEAAAPTTAASDPANGTGSPPAPPGPWWPGARMTACAVLAGLVIGVLAALASRHATRPSAGDAAASQQAAVRDEAARWVAQQVRREATVSCDRVMCAALRAHGFPGGRLMTLGPASDPPKGSDVVVETPAVRVIAPHGVAVYQVLLRAGLAARKRAGAALLHDPRVTVPPGAAGQLAGGLVDSRLLAALAALARHQPIRIVRFGNAGPGASQGIPLRVADLGEDDQAARLTRTAYMRSVRARLSAMSGAFQRHEPRPHRDGRRGRRRQKRARDSRAAARRKAAAAAEPSSTCQSW